METTITISAKTLATYSDFDCALAILLPITHAKETDKDWRRLSVRVWASGLAELYAGNRYAIYRITVSDSVVSIPEGNYDVARKGTTYTLTPTGDAWFKQVSRMFELYHLDSTVSSGYRTWFRDDMSRIPQIIGYITKRWDVVVVPHRIDIWGPILRSKAYLDTPIDVSIGATPAGRLGKRISVRVEIGNLKVDSMTIGIPLELTDD